MGLPFGHTVDVILPHTEGFPLGINKMLYFDVVVIEPVLVFPGLMANGVSAGLKKCGLKGFPVFLHVLWIFFREPLKQVVLKLLQPVCVSQTVDVEFVAELFPLCPPPLPQLDVHGRADEAVVSPGFVRTDHGLGDVDIFAITGTDWSGGTDTTYRCRTGRVL